MPLIFKPIFTLTPKIIADLLRIEAVKTKISTLPLAPEVLKSLRETARLYTTHYSTMIEGNALTFHEIRTVLVHEGHFPGRTRDEAEVKGYYAALTKVEQWAARKNPLTERMLQTLHALVMQGGKTIVTPTPYRDGQNVIKDGKTRTIVYLPPEAHDVPELMQALVTWINTSTLPCAVIASIAHYQFAAIHPYYDGNGRTARLLTTFILHAGGYDLKGLYALEEYYATNLGAYYEAISVGPSHNYYLGRADTDITNWIAYFIEGMAYACEKILTHMESAQKKNLIDHTPLLKNLTPQQRKALELFIEHETVTSKQIGQLFGFKPRTSSGLCAKWAQEGFLVVVNSSKKARTYTLAQRYKVLLS